MSNRLSQESSPYLRQHANNPVAWEPWGPEAFEKARRENKPVFLSIGYATCHWCHVMAHESFEDEEVGRLLNEDFVSIKLDREERPDVDKVYMTYVQSMTGRGGWPLNVFLSPDLKPFFGGTYYPPEDRQGHPGFKTVVRAIAHAWRTDPGQLLGEGERVVGALSDHFSAEAGRGAAAGEGTGWLEKTWPAAYAYFNEAFDPNLGGFGGAPKFPQPGNLQFLLRYAAGTDDAQERTEARRMVTQTLGRMSCGGIHDHVGGGYHRYSVDEYWFIPHFEKMLYDQAQLCCAALSTWQATHDERFAWIARDILQYALRDLGRPGGGFFAAEDADSPVSAEPGAECREGAFYLWGAAELRQALGEDHVLFAEHFGVKEEGNVPEHLDPHGDFSGLNHLAQQRPLAETAAKLGLAVPEAGRRLAEGLERLRRLRERRPRPLRDEKIVCAWNGMMISALARASSCPSPVLRGAWEAFGGRAGAELCLEAARATARFLLKELWDEASGTLLRSWCGGIPGPRAVSEDYACLIKGLIDLYEADFDPEWLRVAERLQDDMILRFHDDEGGGFYNSEAGAPDLILRLKEDYDGAEPAPSSLAVSNLLRLSAMLGRAEYRTQALAALEAFRPHWEKFPQAMPVMLTSLELALLFPPQKVLLTGELSGGAGRALLDVLWEDSGRPRVLLGLPAGGDHAWLRSRNSWLAGLDGEGVATVRLCTQEACLPPVVDAGAFREQLWRI